MSIHHDPIDEGEPDVPHRWTEMEDGGVYCSVCFFSYGRLTSCPGPDDDTEPPPDC